MHTRYISPFLRAPVRLYGSPRPSGTRHLTCRAIATPDDYDDYYGIDDDHEGEAKPECEEDEPDKFYRIDPGELHYYRATFERLFHSAIAPLTGDELKKIMQGRRLQLTMEGSSVMLMVYTEPWSNATDDTWDGMAALLSDWSADAIVRELDLTAPFKDPMFIPLKVRRV